MPVTRLDPPVYPIAEQSSGQYTASITNEKDEVLSGADLSSLTLTLYVKGPGRVVAYVNGRNHQNVLNQNDVTASVAGVLTWTITPNDTRILNPTLKDERHIALFEWTWAAGAKSGKAEIILAIKNLVEVG